MRQDFSNKQTNKQTNKHTRISIITPKVGSNQEAVGIMFVTGQVHVEMP